MAYRGNNNDWKCSSCGYSNFKRRDRCKSCGAGKSSRATGRGGGGGVRQASTNRKPGDWICPSCNENNFASRRKCFRCNNPKPRGGEQNERPPRENRREERGDRRRDNRGAGRRSNRENAESARDEGAQMEVDEKERDFSRVEIASGTFATLAAGGVVEAVEVNAESAVQSIRVEWHTGPSNGKANALFRESGSALLFVEKLKTTTIGGRRLRTEDPVPFQVKGEEFSKVHLQNVPPDYDDEMLTRAIDGIGVEDFAEAYVFRREVAQYASQTTDMIAAMLRSMFGKFGLIRLKSHPPHFGTSAAILDFPDTDSCLAAIGEFNNTESSLGDGRLKVKLDLRCIVQTQQDVWDVLQRDIDDLMYTIRRDRAGFPTVKVFLFGRDRSATGVSRAVVCGSDAAAVCKARELYNDLLRPLVLYCDNDAVVNLLSRELGEHVRQNNLERRVWVRPFPASGIIRVFAAPETRNALNEFSQNVLERMVSQSVTVAPRVIRQLMASPEFDGLNKGENEYNVFVSANLRAGVINVTGLEEEEHLRYIEETFGDTDMGEADAGETKEQERNDEELCGVCFMEIEEGEASTKLESCSHVFHSECFTHQCKSSLNVTGTRPLTCAQCSAPVELKAIGEFLTLEEMVDLSKLCASDYVRTHPVEYKQCPTPDCPQIYPANGQRLFNCSECLRQYCMTCRNAEGSIVNYHAGMTCEGFQASMNADESFAKFMKRYADSSKSKECPYCHTMTDKFTNTCNHATCVYCKTHFCWKCLWVSDSDRFNGQLVYRHMTSAHGGWYTR